MRRQAGLAPSHLGACLWAYSACEEHASHHLARSSPGVVEHRRLGMPAADTDTDTDTDTPARSLINLY